MALRHVEAAVIGFGPCGAVAAAMLGRAGFTTLAIDRAREVYDKPRAIAIDHEILRMLDGMGLAEAVLPFTAPFPASEHFGAEGQLIRRIDMVAEPYPMGFTPTMVFTQPPVEEVLRADAAAQPGVTVELGTELVGISQDAERVTLRLKCHDGAEEVVTADTVIACDGASSFARRSLGIGFEDLVFDEPWLVVDLLVEPAALATLPVNAAQFCEPTRPITYIVGPGHHRRFEIMLNPGEDPQAMQAEDVVLGLLSRWIAPGDARLWRAASYRFHALVAAEWRRGRVFLAGDAAHQQPPFIGQGMCQGLRDVANLVWKLQAVRDGAAPALLDSYAEERGRHVRTLTARIKAIGRQICERDPEAARARDAALIAQGGGQAPVVTRQEIVPPLEVGFLSVAEHPARGTLFPQPWVRDGAGWARMDRVTGGGWRLIRDGEWVERDGVAAAWFARHGVTAAIIRPDNYVYGVATDAASLSALCDELRGALGLHSLPMRISA